MPWLFHPDEGKRSVYLAHSETNYWIPFSLLKTASQIKWNPLLTSNA